MRHVLLSTVALVACAGGSAQQVDRVTAPPGAAGPPASLPAPVAPASEGPSDADLARATVQVELGTYAPADLRAVLSTEARRFKSCYAEALGRNPDIDGSMALTVRLTDGRPQRDDAVDVDATGDWRLVSCVEAAVQEWVVPGAPTEELAFTLRFRARA